MIKVNNLVKTFGNIKAVNNISFEAQRGQIFGLLGPNGAGKTTTLRMLYGLYQASAGQIHVDHQEIQSHLLSVQRKIGVLPDGNRLYARLTARENITYYAQLHGVKQTDINKRMLDFCDRLNMHSILDRKTLGFSQGERMKVSLTRALIHHPDYVFLDEPTNGLDVLTTKAVRELLQDLKQQNKCIIFSSHLMHEVSALCNTIAIMNNGKIAIQGSVDEVLASSAKTDLEDAFIHFAYGAMPEASP